MEDKIKTRQGSGYLKQLYSTARVTAGSTHSHLKNLTTFLVNFIPVDKVDASELQVRTHFDDSEIEALSHSIKMHGVLQPILVVQDGDRYKVIAGERRLRASKLAGIERIPARVLSTDDKATHEIALRENLDRVDLHPIEEGEGYLSLLESKAYSSHESIAKGFGKPKSRITECVGFTRLPQNTKVMLLNKNIKNRSLLRQLMTLPEEQHAAMIEAAAQTEETLALSMPTGPNASSGGKKAPIKAFSCDISSEKIMIPAFRWKAKDGQEAVVSYLETMRKTLSQIEDLLTAPKAD